jgi:hypothetical protein
VRATCVWCREALPAFGAPAACPSCGKDLHDLGGGRLRPIDLDFERLLAEADASSLKWTKRGAVFAALVALLGVPGLFLPLLSGAAFVVLFVGQFFWARFLVARPYRRHFSAPRRLVTRWLTRLFLIVVVAPLHGSSLAIPFAGVVLCPLLFAGTCWAFRAYFRFHFEREHRREGILLAEKVFLVVLACAFVVLLVVLALVLWGALSLLPR